MRSIAAAIILLGGLLAGCAGNLPYYISIGEVGKISVGEVGKSEQCVLPLHQAVELVHNKLSRDSRAGHLSVRMAQRKFEMELASFVTDVDDPDVENKEKV